MIAMKRGCLNSEELGLVLRGGLPAEEFESALSHLDDCEKCRAAAESLQQDGPWMIESLEGEPDPLQAETACQVALWQVLETPGFGPSALAAAPQETLGPYRLIRPLGSGGMAAVYLAEHVRLRRKCAIKILPRDRVDQPGWLERFDREMTTVASLEHVNVVRATDAGHQDGWHYLVMEYLDGLDVGRVAARLGQLDIASACEIARQAALGLDHIHASGLVHRDVKPSNLMLTGDGQIKLLDLGLVLSGDDPLSIDDRLTTVGHLMGTMPYMAPEQLIDSRDVDHRADIYALGATLYRLIAGRPPHPRRGGLARQVMAITHEDAPRLCRVREDVDEELSDFVAMMIARQPDGRPQTANEVAERLSKHAGPAQLKRLLRTALRRAASDSAVPSSLLTMTRNQPAEPPRRRRVWAVATGFVFVLLLIAGWMLKIATDRGELVIQSESDGVVIAVTQGDEVVDRLRIEAGSDNRLTLRKGTYRVEIEGAGELALSNNVVTIGRGTSSKLELKPRSAMRLYQGKDLATWMDLLEREEDADTLGQVMAAVEVLTRDTDKRTEAAKATLKTARIWGGFSSSGPGRNNLGMVNRDQSSIYMYYLMEVFPQYEAAGLKAIDLELDQGNDRSRIAAIWLLLGLSERQFEMPDNLLEHLRKAIAGLDGSDVKLSENALNLSQLIAVRLLIKQEASVIEQNWLEPYVQLSVQEAVEQWHQENPDDGVPQAIGYGTAESSVVQEPILAAAVQLQQAGRLEINWNWMADNLVAKSYARTSARTDELFDLVAARAADELLEAISSRLHRVAVPVVDGSRYGGYGGSGPSTASWYGGHWIPAFQLGEKNSVWPKALSYYAANASDPPASIELLQRIRETMITSGVIPDHPAQPMQFLDAAIETLKSRT